MKDGHCPMCNSSEVYTNQVVKFYGSNTKVYLMDDGRKFDIQAHFCMNCGFTAIYVQDMETIKDLPKTAGWTKVTK
jgi:predicted nucleic-acid-binding Zn-ribbon protein